MAYENNLKSNRVLPNFFCIGVMRGGSSWLYERLRTHPEIYLCSYHKETHFFSRYYDRGLNWYSKFFPKIEGAKKYKAIGEIAPTYYFKKDVPKLILKHSPNARFIIILRNPVNRAFSEYKYNKLNLGFKDSLEEYLKKNPYIFEIGLYAQHLKNWFNYFSKNRFLILIFEDLVVNPLKALKNIAKFLDIDIEKINKKNLRESVNPSKPPRFSKLYLLGSYVYNFFLLKGLYKFARIFSNVRPYLYLLGEKQNEEIEPSIRNHLYLKYEKDIKELEKIVNKDLSIWKY